MSWIVSLCLWSYTYGMILYLSLLRICEFYRFGKTILILPHVEVAYLETMTLIPMSGTLWEFCFPESDSFSTLIYMDGQLPCSFLRLASRTCRKEIRASGFMQSLVLTLVGVTSFFLSPDMLNSSLQPLWPVSDSHTLGGWFYLLFIHMTFSFLFDSGTLEFPYLAHLVIY